MANRRKLKKLFLFSQPAASFFPSSLTCFFVAQAKLTIIYRVFNYKISFISSFFYFLESQRWLWEIYFYKKKLEREGGREGDCISTK